MAFKEKVFAVLMRFTPPFRAANSGLPGRKMDKIRAGTEGSSDDVVES